MDNTTSFPTALLLILVGWCLVALYFDWQIKTEFFRHRDEFDPDAQDSQESCETIGLYHERLDTRTALQRVCAVVAGTAAGLCVAATLVGACAAAAYSISRVL